MTDSTSAVPVLICGAGPTGLALGIRLRQRGVPCLIIERLAQPLPWSRALGLQPRSREILAALGVLEAVEAQALPLQRVHLHGERGVLGQLVLSQLGPDTVVSVLPQRQLEQMLTDRYLALGGELWRDCELMALTDSGSQVTAVVSRAGQRVPLTADWLAGCDGIGSRVRDQAGIDFPGQRYPLHFLMADLDLDWPQARDSSHGYLLADGLLVATPLPQGWRFMLQLDDRDLLQPDTSLTPLARRLQRLGAAPIRPEQCRWSSHFMVHRRLASHYRRGRVLLAGDAAHAQSPLGAQGMNAGLADAFALGWRLAQVCRGELDPRVLDDYEAERRPLAEAMLRRVDRLARLALLQRRPWRGLRDGGLRWCLRWSPVQRRLLRWAGQLGTHYRLSPAVAGQALPGARRQPGDRLPMLSLWDPQAQRMMSTMTALQQGHHQLWIQWPATVRAQQQLAVGALVWRLCQEAGDWLTVTVVVPESAPVLPFDGEVQVRCDRQGQLRQLTGTGQGLWWVRPDGHLGWCGPLERAADLMQWLAASQAGPTPSPAL